MNKKKRKTKAEGEKSSAWATGKASTVTDDGKILLVITQHPLKKNILLSMMAIVIILLTGLIAYIIIQNIFMPILVYLFFIVSMTSFFMPSRYTFTEEKIIIDRIIYKQSYPWKRFRSFKIDKNGIFLSPSSNPDRFDRFRGVFMVMDNEGREKAIPVLEEKLVGTKGN